MTDSVTSRNCAPNNRQGRTEGADRVAAPPWFERRLRRLSSVLEIYDFQLAAGTRGVPAIPAHGRSPHGPWDLRSCESANSEARATASASKANGEQRPVSGPQAREQMWQKRKRFVACGKSQISSTDERRFAFLVALSRANGHEAPVSARPLPVLPETLRGGVQLLTEYDFAFDSCSRIFPLRETPIARSFRTDRRRSKLTECDFFLTRSAAERPLSAGRGRRRSALRS